MIFFSSGIFFFLFPFFYSVIFVNDTYRFSLFLFLFLEGFVRRYTCQFIAYSVSLAMKHSHPANKIKFEVSFVSPFCVSLALYSLLRLADGGFGESAIEVDNV